MIHMKQTLREQVLQVLTYEYPEHLSNEQIAHRLDAHAASVRRVTRLLREEGLIMDIDGGYANIPLTYQLRRPITAASTIG